MFLGKGLLSKSLVSVSTKFIILLAAREMKIIPICVTLFHLVNYCVGQVPSDSLANKIRLTLSAEAGQSTFAANTLKSQSKFPTTEVRLGLGVIKPLGKHFDLISGLNLGGKIKGERVYPPGSSPPGISFRLSPPFNELEETVNSRNHYFFEIPLLIQYSIFDKKIGFRVGGNYRNFLPNNGYEDSTGQYNFGPDFLSNKKEFGILSGISVRLGESLCLKGNFYFGVTRVYSEYYAQINSFEDFPFSLRNRFWQVGLEYALQKRPSN